MRPVATVNCAELVTVMHTSGTVQLVEQRAGKHDVVAGRACDSVVKLLRQLTCCWRCASAELPKDPRRIGGKLYDLTFVNVTTKYAQVVQCNISNKHGWSFTNAYINVYSQYWHSR